MGRAYKQWQRMHKNRSSSPVSKQSREFGHNLRKENEDLWERAQELGVWGGGGDSWSLSDWGDREGNRDARKKAGLWKQASMAMGMGDISNEKDLQKLLDTYDKAGIKNFDSANDVMDFKKAYEKEQFKSMFEQYAEEWGFNAPEGYQWGEGRGPGKQPGDPNERNPGYGHGPGQTPPPPGYRHPNDRGGSIDIMMREGRPEGVSDNQIRDITKWLGIEDADSWGRRGDRDSNLMNGVDPAYQPGAPVQAIPGANNYQSQQYGGEIARWANNPLDIWFANQAGGFQGQNPYLQYGAGPMTRR